MAGYIVALGTQLLTPTGYLSNSFPLTTDVDSSEFPKTFIGSINKPFRPWKSSTAGGAPANVVSGTTYVGADFGAPVSLAAVVIDTSSVAAVKIQAASNSGFSAGPMVDSGAIGISPNEVDGRYKRIVFIAPTPIGSATRQYWRVLANTSVTTTGLAGRMSIGAVAWVQSYTQWASGTSEYTEQPIEATRPNDNFDGGGSDPVILGNPYSAIILSASPASRTAMRSDLLALLRQGIGRWFVFYKNGGDVSEVYIVRRAADVGVRQTAPTLITFDSLVLEGAV